jgi:hypothetical protein
MRVANHNKLFRIFFIFCRWHCFLMKHFQNVKTCLYRTLLFMYMELRGWVVITLPLYCRGPRSILGPLSAIQTKLFPTCPQFLQANTSILLKLEYLRLTFFISFPVHYSNDPPLQCFEFSQIFWLCSEAEMYGKKQYVEYEFSYNSVPSEYIKCRDNIQFFNSTCGKHVSKRVKNHPC